MGDRDRPVQAEQPQEPWYLLLFEAASPDAPYEPIIYAHTPAPADVTQPHGFDLEVAAVLDALWFTLHLPRRVQDTIDLPLRFLADWPVFDQAHQITLIPTPFLDDKEWCAGLRRNPPALVISPVAWRARARSFAEEVGVRLGAITYEQLDQRTLGTLWRKIAMFFPAGERQHSKAVRLGKRSAASATLLPALFLARQMKEGSRQLALHGQSLYVLKRLVHIHAVVAALSAAERQGHSEVSASEVFPELYRAARGQLRLPGVMAAPGVATKYRDRIARYLSRAPTRQDQETEAAVIHTLVAHRAAARAALACVTKPISAEMYGLYAQLEGHARSHRVAGRASWRLIRKLGAMVARALGRAGEYVARHSSSLTSFGDFPIGLAILPGDTSPLTCRTPINYLPLTPLTRRLQFELAPHPRFDWTQGVRVLIAECLAPDDRLYKASQGVWAAVSRVINASRQSTCRLVEIRDERQLQAVVRAEPADILVLSAHGRYSVSQNAAHLMIGHDMSLLLEMDDVSPLVVLSACHVAPRATGAVTVADLLFRAGAKAVIGTLVPIDVLRNGFLMARFFSNLCEAIDGTDTRFRTLDVLWHHIATTHTVHDIYSASRQIQQWAFSRVGGVSVDEEFKNVRSRGRLHGGHIHRDTETVLMEIAKDRGFDRVLATTLSSVGYFPESIFYALLGRGDRFILLPEYRDLLSGRRPPGTTVSTEKSAG